MDQTVDFVPAGASPGWEPATAPAPVARAGGGSPLQITVRPPGAYQSAPFVPSGATEGWGDETATATAATPAPGPAPAPSMRSLLTDYLNQGSAASQGTTANIGVQAPNLVSSQTYENDAGKIQYKDPATGELVSTDQNKQVALRNPDDQSVGVYNRSPDTEEGRLSGLGHLMETGMGPGSLARPVTMAGPAAAREAAIASGNRLGVDIPSAIVSTSPLARLGGQVAARAPGGGPFQEAVKTSLGQLDSATGKAVEIAGGSVDPAVAGGGFRSGIETHFKPTVKARTEAAYGEVSKLTDPNVKTPLSATQKTVEDITARRLASGEDDPGKAVKTVLGGVYKEGQPATKTILKGDGYHIADEVATREGLTFNGVKDLRTRIGEMLDEGPLPEGLSEAELRGIYKSLSSDLETAARNAGGQPAVDALARASAVAKHVAGWKDSIRKVLGSKVRSDEGITETILRSARTDGGDLNTLARARKAVPPDAWKDIASTAISRLGRNNKGEFSPTIYLSDYAKLSDRGKALLFASVGQRDLIPFLDDIAGVSKAFYEAGKMGNPSGSAGHADLLLTLSSALTAAAGGYYKAAAGIAAGPVVNNLMARVLATKATAASMARWSRAYDAVTSNPTPNAIAVFNMTSRNFANTLNGEMGTKVDPAELTKAIQGVGSGNAGIPR